MFSVAYSAVGFLWNLVCGCIYKCRVRFIFFFHTDLGICLFYPRAGSMFCSILSFALFALCLIICHVVMNFKCECFNDDIQVLKEETKYSRFLVDSLLSQHYFKVVQKLIGKRPL